MRRFIDALLTTDALQRVRLKQAFLAIELMAAGVLTVHYFAWAGLAPGAPLAAWTAVSVAGIVGGYLLVRSGATRGLQDPSLTVPMMAFAIACATWAYAFLGAGRGAVFPIVMVTLMFGMFVATPRQIAWMGLYAVVLLGAVMLTLARLEPQRYPLAVEVGHFLIVATMMPAVAVLAARLAHVRERSRRHRAELEAALGRIRELATHDELTGLVNRRHLRELMDQEHQRCIRNGQTFCVAVIAVDAFDARAAAAGGADALVRAVAREAQRSVRVADVLGRWEGGRFVLLMSDTRAALARGGLDRLRERVALARLLPEAAVTLSAGLAEHHAGETVTQTLERAEAAQADARDGGGDRVVIA
jgi:diguanylate cyclase